LLGRKTALALESCSVEAREHHQHWNLLSYNRAIDQKIWWRKQKHAVSVSAPPCFSIGCDALVADSDVDLWSRMLWSR
jgi:hypothetical protein